MPTVRPIDPAVKSVLASLPVVLRTRLLELRTLIFRTAQATPGVGALRETLKWRGPAYLPQASRIGTTVRINALRGAAEHYACSFIVRRRWSRRSGSSIPPSSGSTAGGRSCSTYARSFRHRLCATASRWP